MMISRKDVLVHAGRHIAVSCAKMAE